MSPVPYAEFIDDHRPVTADGLRALGFEVGGEGAAGWAALGALRAFAVLPAPYDWTFNGRAVPVPQDMGQVALLVHCLVGPVGRAGEAFGSG